MKTAVRTRPYPPSGLMVGMFQLIHAWIRERYPNEVVLAITAGTAERLERLGKAGVINDRTITDTFFEHSCYQPPAEWVTIKCATREEALELRRKVPDGLGNVPIYIFVNGKLTDNLT